MPAAIDSAPDCVISEEVDGTSQASIDASAEDSADFILNDNYAECAGIMTFGPGSTYGEEGAAADTAYYILTWLGIAAVIVFLLAWVYLEHRRLTGKELFPK